MVTVAFAFTRVCDGMPSVMVGGVVSMVKDMGWLTEVFPSASIAVAIRVCDPSAIAAVGVNVHGDALVGGSVKALNAPGNAESDPSRASDRVTVWVSMIVPEKVGMLMLVSAGGGVKTRVGGVVSTVTVIFGVVGLVLPMGSLAAAWMNRGPLAWPVNVVLQDVLVTVACWVTLPAVTATAMLLAGYSDVPLTVPVTVTDEPTVAPFVGALMTGWAGGPLSHTRLTGEAAVFALDPALATPAGTSNWTVAMPKVPGGVQVALNVVPVVPAVGSPVSRPIDDPRFVAVNTGDAP